MGQIIYLDSFDLYLEKLIDKLYEEKYFGFLDSSYNYIEKIYSFIFEFIFKLNHLKSPKELANLGEFYIFYNPNPRTTWYILFDKIEEGFLITYIFNNHSKESSFII